MNSALKRPVSSPRPLQFSMVMLSLLLALQPLATRGDSAGNVRVSSYSGTETGVHDISFVTVQDERGVLYFGSAALLTFDGDHWKKAAVPDSFAIRSLNFGPDGRLWAGAMGDLGWFEQSAASEWVFKSLRAHLPPGDETITDVWGVQADDQGATFISVTHVLRWDGNRLVTWLKASEGKLYPIQYNGRQFVHNFKAGLYELESSGPRLLLPGGTVDESGILWLEQHGPNWLLGTSKGFFKYDGKSLEHFAPGLVRFLNEGRLTCASRLPDGRIAVGTLRNGLAILRPDGSVESILNDPDRIPSLHITSIFVGRDRELWLTTGSHILRLDLESRSTIFDSRSGLPRRNYRMITKAMGRVFVGNESGVYELPENRSKVTAIDPLRGRWHHLQGAPEALIVSGFRGTFRWTGSTLTRLYTTHLDVSHAVDAPRGDGILLAEGGAIMLRPPTGEPRTLVKNLPDFVHSMASDPTGRLWIGTLARGLFVATPEEQLAVQAQDTAGKFGLPKLSGTVHVRISRAGTIVILTNGGAWQKPADAAEFRRIARFPVRTLAAVSEMTDQDHIWTVHESTGTLSACVGRISLAGQEASWEPHSVDALLDAGSPRSIFADEASTGESVVWIGGTQALLRHAVGGQLAVPTPRPPLLRAYAREAGDAGRKPIVGSLRYSTEQVEFEFAAPEFSRRSLLRIETRIEGIDREWTPLPAGSRRELTAVRDGHYTVRARVVAETGATSRETTFSFQVLPPFWRTAPFLIGVGVLLLPVGYCLYVLRIRALSRRNAELELKVRERTEELVAASAAKTQFVANMSHDIRNPLNGIVGLALALEDTRLAPRQREIVATLRECTTYLSSLVDDVLDFASIEAGRVELRPRAYAPDELLRSIVETLKADATSSGAVLTIASAPDLPASLFGDASRIQQILVNFVSNALKYAGGAIRLSAHAPVDSPGEIEFAVTDEGPGISAADQATLFTKFSRLRPQRGGEEIPGTGLGLASCRLLADIMGGSVGVRSEPGQGARFFLRLPLTVAIEAAAEPVVHLPQASVLLVEDTDYNAWAATAVLSRLGLTCERARTGAEALQRFGAKRFNVVLLDRNLPDMDGTEVARRMREMESDGAQAVLLAVTAYCTAEDRELCLRAGMDAFVGKPLTPEKLRSVLIAAGRRLLAAASMQAAPETHSVELDTSLLAYLSDGSPGGLQTQFNRFLASLDQLEAEIKAAALADDLAALRTGAHRLHGQAKMIGGTALAEVALELEQAARAGEAALGRNLLPRIRTEVQAVTEAMLHHRPAARSA